MAKFKYVGDPRSKNPNDRRYKGGNPETVTLYGKTFTLDGPAVDVPEGAAAEKLRGNNHFEEAGGGRGKRVSREDWEKTAPEAIEPGELGPGPAAGDAPGVVGGKMPMETEPGRRGEAYVGNEAARVEFDPPPATDAEARERAERAAARETLITGRPVIAAPPQPVEPDPKPGGRRHSRANEK